MAHEYSERAARILADAEAEARRFRHEYVGTEHLLLALTVDPGVAARVLRSLGIDPPAIRREVDAIVLQGPGDRVVTGRLPHTPRAESALRYAAAEARGLGRAAVGPEHLLLGLAREEEGLAAQVLLNLGVAPGVLRAEIHRRRPVPADWRSEAVVAIARGIAAAEAYDRLPVLADALEDAGCADPEVLGHARQGADHGCRSPGCWVLDRLLENEPGAGDDQPDTGPAARPRPWWRLWG